MVMYFDFSNKILLDSKNNLIILGILKKLSTIYIKKCLEFIIKQLYYKDLDKYYDFLFINQFI